MEGEDKQTSIMVTNSDKKIVIKCCNKKYKADYVIFETIDILIEILIRLPIVCVFRYKTVCKDWYELISSHNFINSFDNHRRELDVSHVSLKSSFTLFLEYEFYIRPSVGEAHKLYSFHIKPMPGQPLLSNSYDNLDFLQSLYKNKEADAKYYPIHVLNSCHDLLLCYRTHMTKYYVINLLTKHWILLPPVPPLRHVSDTFKKKFPHAGILCHRENAIATSTPSNCCRFKVILVYIPVEQTSSRFYFRIFCSESRRWTKLVIDTWYPTHPYTYPSHMISHNGMLHWLHCDLLFSLDLFNCGSDLKFSHIIRFPQGVVRGPGHESIFGVSEGHVRVGYIHRENGSYIRYLLVWEVEDYNKGLWCLKHRVPLRNPLISFLSFHPFRKNIIFILSKGFIRCLNIQTGKVKWYSKLKVDEDCLKMSLKCSRAVLLHHQWYPTPLPLHAGL